MGMAVTKSALWIWNTMSDNERDPNKTPPESEINHDPAINHDDEEPEESVNEAVYEDVEDNTSDELSEIKRKLQDSEAEDGELNEIEAIESGQEYIKIGRV